MIKYVIKLLRGSKLVAPFALLVVMLFPLNANSYFAETTHSQLTREAAKLFNKGPKNLSDQDINYLIKGAVDEDTPPRWLNHFYDPITGEGWNGGGVNGISPEVIKYLASFGLSYEDIASAKKWAEDPLLQNSYLLYQGDQTWQKAISEYVKGNKRDAFIALGHVLHLLEDMTVPDHTRGDTHSGILTDPTSFYEVWAKKYTDTNRLNLSENTAMISFDNLGKYFDSLAMYSNKYFISKDSIDKYEFPKIVKEQVGRREYFYTYDEVGNKFLLYFKVDGEYFFDKDDIMSAYWQRLAPKAVGAGAGVINLFFKEVEDAKNHPEKYAAPSAPVALAINLSNGRLPLISIFGELSRINNIANSTIAFFKNLYSGSKADEPIGSTTDTAAGGAVNTSVPTEPPPVEQTTIGQESSTVAPVDKHSEAAPKQPTVTDNVPASTENLRNDVDIPAPVDSLAVESPVIIPPATESSATEPPPLIESVAATTSPDNGPPANPAPVEPVYAPIPHTPRMGPAQNPEEPPPPPPDTTAPSVSFVNFGTFHKMKDFQINWMGSDDSGAVKSYDLDWIDVSTTTPWQSVTSSTADTSLNFSGEDKHSYNFRLRGADAAGNISAWVESGTTTIRVPHVVISEVQIGGASASDEFVELYNPGDAPVDLSGWKLQKVTGSGKTRDNLLSSFPAAQISAHGFYLITHPSGFTGSVTPDAVYSTQNSLAADNTAVLYDSSGMIVDELGFGSASESETASAMNPSSGGSLERKASANSTSETMTSGGDEELMGNGEDTDKNIADFIIRVASDPQNSENAPEPRSGDEAEPGRITDLRAAIVETAADSAKLLWSTPKDAKLGDSPIYDIRYLPQPSSAGCTLNILWNSASRVVPNPVPQDTEGAAESISVSGLSANSYYCFGIKTWNGYQWSDLSNLFVVKTLRSGGTLADRVTYLPEVVKRGTLTLTPDNNPYYVGGNTWIQTGAKLVIEPGVIVKFKPFYFSGVVNIPTALMIDGEIQANGTAENPIIFTSERDDRFGGDTDGDGGANPPVPGSWGAVRFGAGGSIAAAIDYAQFYYGGQTASNDANLGGALFWQGSRDFTIKNSVFQNNLGGIYAVDTLGAKKMLRVEDSSFDSNANWNLKNSHANVETIGCTPPDL